MKKLEITVNGYNYTLACDDGQESHVEQLSEEVNMRAEQVAGITPKASEAMTLVMTCLMLADELYEARQEAGALHEKLAGIGTPMAADDGEAGQQAQATLALAMNEIADHLEEMAERIEKIA